MIHLDFFKTEDLSGVSYALDEDLDQIADALNKRLAKIF